MDPAKSAVKGEQMAIKNRNNNDLALHHIWVFGIVLSFASLLGLFLALNLGIASTSPLAWGLALGVFVGVGLFMFSSLNFWASMPFPKEKEEENVV